MTSMRTIVQKVAVVIIIWVIAFALNFSFLAAPAVALNHCPKRYPVDRTRPSGLSFPGGQKPKQIPMGFRPIFPGFQFLPYFFPAGVGYPGTYFFPAGTGYSGAYPFSAGASYPKPSHCRPGTLGGQKSQTETTNNPTPLLSTTGTLGGQKSQTETTSTPTPSPSTTDDESG